MIKGEKQVVRDCPLSSTCTQSIIIKIIILILVTIKLMNYSLKPAGRLSDLFLTGCLFLLLD